MRKLTVRPVFLLALLAAVGTTLLWSDSGANHQVFVNRPIPCGISGGNINLSGRAFCCGGTIGALVEDGAAQYLLSNNHIFAKQNTGVAGEAIIQPGLIDQESPCLKDSGDAVANLSDFVTISFKRGTTNTADAAIAQIQAGKVDTSGSILDVGQVAAGNGVAAAVGMAVAKSGRTTGFTQGVVTGLNATLDIRYDKRCGGQGGTARYVNQVVIADAAGGTPEPFSAGGDSGSLITQDPTGNACPGAVGLLFAGSSTTTIANPIAAVQSAFGVTMVGKTCTPSAFAGTSTGSFAAGTQDRQRLAGIAIATDVKERHSTALFGVPGVVGHGVGFSEIDPEAPVIQVYVVRATEKVRQALPTELEGIPVKIVVTGRLVAFCSRD